MDKKEKKEPKYEIGLVLHHLGTDYTIKNKRWGTGDAWWGECWEYEIEHEGDSRMWQPERAITQMIEFGKEPIADEISSPQEVMPGTAIDVAKPETEPRYIASKDDKLEIVGGILTFLHLYSTDGNIEVRLQMDKATIENFEEMMTEIAKIPEAKVIMEKFGLTVTIIKK